MTRPRQQALLARLKGPALSVFLALARDPGLTPTALCAATGWSRNVTYDALQRLAAEGWIAEPQRGHWLLTAAGRAAWLALITGAGRQNPTPRVPDSGTPPGYAVPHSVTRPPLLPESGTTYHSPVPEYGTLVPEYGTTRRPPAVPESVTSTGSSVPENGTGVPENGTNAAPYNNNIINYKEHDPDISDLASAIHAQLPGFDHLDKWLATVNPRLILPWLDFLRANPDKNTVGYLRTVVASGRLPPHRPARPAQPAQRPPCPDCGKSFWDGDFCLYCAGIVKC
jgi:hypothetical protein